MSNYEKIISNMVEVKLIGESSDTFQKIIETLNRMGVSDDEKLVLEPAACILHKRGRYYIAHYTELMALDGDESIGDIKLHDIGIRNYIVELLRQWNLVKVVNRNASKWPMAAPNEVKVVKYSEKHNWTIKKKYYVGRNRVVDNA